MPQLRLIRVFVEVAQAGSYTTAARNLHMARSSVSKHITSLEQMLGVALLTRSTRHVSLTVAGQSFLEGGLRLVRDYERLESEVRASIGSLRGEIRIGAPPAFGAAHLVPAIHVFTRLNPEVGISLLLDDGSLDLVREGLNMSIRIAPGLKDASHVSRFLAQVPQCLVAAPSYLRTHGEPQEPDDLRRHNCLVHSIKSPTNIWRLGEGASAVSVPVSGSLRAAYGTALHQAALLGAGISMHPTYMVRDDIAQGRLKIVLPAAPQPVGLEIHAIYVNRNTSVLVRSFLDFLSDHLSHRSDW
ncbi:LysR family transcriptional regulator [Pseudaminobacter arsenicus]|uniref:LysR family transcriptional regulator n=1 Tax=Borborobacter arsenicus TaxID=1851146 RepID=A0A432V329_9HYPH|nr:LysR family transcriptional regulator [Pseudaminobacter arsenicus]RUM96609.1 LysR family transcriptional regulator [Pseudaminobacter arsenicus]